MRQIVITRSQARDINLLSNVKQQLANFTFDEINAIGIVVMCSKKDRYIYRNIGSIKRLCSMLDIPEWIVWRAQEAWFVAAEKRCEDNAIVLKTYDIRIYGDPIVDG